MSSLADIIAQETEDGRLIVQFLVSAMEGELTDFQPCHRIDAARLLSNSASTRLRLSSTTPAPPSAHPTQFPLPASTSGSIPAASRIRIP